MPTLMENTLEPISANSEVAVAALPVGVHPPPLTSCSYLLSLNREQECGDRHHQAEPREGRNRANFRTLQLETVGFLIQQFLLDLKAIA